MNSEWYHLSWPGEMWILVAPQYTLGGSHSLNISTLLPSWFPAWESYKGI